MGTSSVPKQIHWFSLFIIFGESILQMNYDADSLTMFNIAQFSMSSWGYSQS